MNARNVAVLAASLTILSGTTARAGDFAAWERALASHPLEDRAGNVVRVGELKGEVVVVSFWASWCKPCKRELADLDRWAAQAAQAGLPAPRMMAVSIDEDPKKALNFVNEAALSLPVYLDGPEGLARSLDIPSLPLTLVLDRDGHVAAVARNTSELPALEKKVRSLLSEAREPRVPAAEETPGEIEG